MNAWWNASSWKQLWLMSQISRKMYRIDVFLGYSLFVLIAMSFSTNFSLPWSKKLLHNFLSLIYENAKALKILSIQICIIFRKGLLLNKNRLKAGKSVFWTSAKKWQNEVIESGLQWIIFFETLKMKQFLYLLTKWAWQSKYGQNISPHNSTTLETWKIQKMHPLGDKNVLVIFAISVFVCNLQCYNIQRIISIIQLTCWYWQ